MSKSDLSVAVKVVADFKFEDDSGNNNAPDKMNSNKDQEIRRSPTKCPPGADEDGLLYMKIHSDVDLNANSIYESDQTEDENAQIQEFLRMLLYEEADEKLEEPSPPTPIEDGRLQLDLAAAPLCPQQNVFPTSASPRTATSLPPSSCFKPRTYVQLLETGNAVLSHLEILHRLVTCLKDYTVGPRPINECLSYSLKGCWIRSKCWILAMLEFWNRASDSVLSSSSQEFEDVMSHLIGLQEEHSGISQHFKDTEFSLKQFLLLLQESSSRFGKAHKLAKVILAEAVPILLPVQKKLFKPTVKPIDRSPPVPAGREISKSLGGLPSIRCGVDGFSIWMKWKGEWTWLKTSHMSRRQLLNGITMLNRGFNNFALTTFSYARRLEFSLRRPRNSGNRLSGLDQALAELENGMKNSAFLYAPEQRDLYRVVQEIELAMQGIQEVAEEVRDYTKSARKMWSSFCESKNGKLGRRLYHSPEWELVREMSFSFVIEPLTLFGNMGQLPLVADRSEQDTAAKNPGTSTKDTTIVTPIIASLNIRKENAGAMIRSRSRRLTRGTTVQPEPEDIELCSTAVQLAYLYSEYIVSETNVTLEDIRNLNKNLFRVHWQIPPINAFCRITVWMLISAECLSSVQKTCPQEKDKKRLRTEFLNSFAQFEKIIALAERVAEKFLSLSQGVDKLIDQVLRRAPEPIVLSKNSDDNIHPVAEIADHEEKEAPMMEVPEAKDFEESGVPEPVETEDNNSNVPEDVQKNQPQEIPEAEVIIAVAPSGTVVSEPSEETSEPKPVFKDPLLILADSGLLIDISEQLFNFANLPPTVQMKMFQMILQHIGNLLRTATVTYTETLRLAGYSRVPATSDTKDDDSISKLVDEMHTVFKGFNTVNNLELLVALKCLRGLKDSLLGIRNEIGFINILQRNTLTRQLLNVQNIYDHILFSNKKTPNPYMYNIAHRLAGQLVFPIENRTFERELERVLSVAPDVPNLPAKFRRFSTAKQVGLKLRESIQMLDKTVQRFHCLANLMIQPQPLLPIPESYPSLTPNEQPSLMEAFSIFLAFGLLELNFRPVKYMTTLLKKVEGIEKILEVCVNRQKKAVQFFENSVEKDLKNFRKVVDPLLERECPEPIEPVAVNVEVRVSSGDAVVRWDPARNLMVLGYVGYAKFTPFTQSSCSRQEWILMSLVKHISETVHEVATRGRNYTSDCKQVQKSLDLIRNYVTSSYVASEQLSEIQAIKIRLENTKQSLILLQQHLHSLKGKLKVSIECIKWELARANCKELNTKGLLLGNPIKYIIRKLPVPFQVVLWNAEPQK